MTSRLSRVSRTVPLWIAIPLAMLCGSGIAVQSQINGQLGLHLHDGVTAAVISFGSGLLILIITLLFVPQGRRGLGRVRTALVTRQMPWWYVCGGVAGGFFVLSQGVTVAVLGVALFTVAVVAGQTVSGLILDRIGLGPSGAHPLTPARITGAIIAVIAVTWAVSAELGGSVPGWMLILPLIAGLGLGWQQAVNGQVRVRSDSVLTATFINFFVGTTMLVIVMLIDWSLNGLPHLPPPEPWLYIGGSIGCLAIAGSAFLVRFTGVLLLGLSMLAGQLVAALVIDLTISVGHAGVPISTLGGTLLAFVAVLVASVRWTRREHQPKSPQPAE